MTELAVAVTGFVVMGALCTVLERLWPEDCLQPKWRSDTWIDIFYTSLRIVLSASLVFFTWLTGRAIPGGTPHFAGAQPFWLQFIEVLFLSDLISYWVHRSMHVSTTLWRVHAVHHSASQIDWLVAARVHPVELVIQKVVQSFPLYLLGFSPSVFAVTVPLTATYSLLIHANLAWTFGPFRFVIASPAYHRWHHSADLVTGNKNFAQMFPAIDWLFGTLHLPAHGHPNAYGLHGPPIPASIWQHMVYPCPPAIRRMFHSWSGRKTCAPSPSLGTDRAVGSADSAEPSTPAPLN
jgi:sterol desaturase/sphingolipid hydroxylase (fatty acid hydroxylase superfamily)